MPDNPSFQEIDGLFNRFHSEFEAIVMDMLGDKVSYNLLSCVFCEDRKSTRLNSSHIL